MVIVWTVNQEAALARLQRHAAQTHVRRSNSPLPMVLHVQLAVWGPRLCGMWEHGGRHGGACGGREREHGKPLVSLHVCVFSRLQYFFLIFTSLSLLFSCNCAGFVLIFLLRPFLHLIFSFRCGFIPFYFFNFASWFSSFFHIFDKTRCTCLFSLFPFSFPFSQTFSFSQHWNTGGSHPEELERPGTHPRLKARPQPPLFHPFISAEPQFTDCVALSERSIPGDQIALQVNIIMKN